MQIPNHVTPITEDIYRVQLPLPFALNSVNCYLLKDDNGWVIIDSGLNLPQAQAAWQSAFTALDLRPRDIHQIVLTHFHPDHFGMAGWLQQLGRTDGREPPVWMSPREAEQAWQVWGLPVGQIDPMAGFFRSFGVPTDLLQAMTEGMTYLRGLTHPLPTVNLLEPGSTLQVGRRTFLAMHSPGHSDGHLVFYDAADQLLLCGDHVLMKITPHIGTWPNSEPRVLDRFLLSLKELIDLEVRLALPGHGPLIEDWSGRLAELMHHHALRLEDMFAVAHAGATVFKVSTHIFDFTRLTAHEIRFAVAETISHLELLVQQNRLRRDDQDGVFVYRAA